MNKEELDKEIKKVLYPDGMDKLALLIQDMTWITLVIRDFTTESLLDTKSWIEKEILIRRSYILDDKYLVIIICASDLLDLLHLGMNMSFEFPEGDEFPITVDSVVTINYYD